MSRPHLHLDSLPEEILLMIARELHEVDQSSYPPHPQPYLLNLRLVSKLFDQIALPLAAEQWFGQRAVMLAQNSLDRDLREFSEHPAFRLAVKSIVINPVHIPDPGKNIPGTPPPDPDWPDSEFTKDQNDDYQSYLTPSQHESYDDALFAQREATLRAPTYILAAIKRFQTCNPLRSTSQWCPPKRNVSVKS